MEYHKMSELNQTKDLGLVRFFNKVYGLMIGALLISAVVAYLVANNFYTILFSVGSNVQAIFWLLLIGELVLVWMISANIHKYSYQKLLGLFVLYSVVNGMTLSFIFVVWTNTQLLTAFVATAIPFGFLSAYGRITKHDLTPLGKFLFIGIIGLFVVALMNIFFQSSMMSLVAAFVGVVLFAALTAYDNNKLKQMYYAGYSDDRVALSGALSLYLDFINLFLFVLRLTSRD